MRQVLIILGTAIMLAPMPIALATQMKSGPSEEEIQKKIETWEALKEAEKWRKWRKDLKTLEERYNKDKADALDKCNKILTDLETQVASAQLPEKSFVVAQVGKILKRTNLSTGATIKIYSKADFKGAINKVREDIKKETKVTDAYVESIKKRFLKNEGQAIMIENNLRPNENEPRQQQISKEEYLSDKSRELLEYPGNTQRKCDAFSKKLGEITTLYKEYKTQASD